MRIISTSVLSVTLKYAYERNGTFYYQRPVPSDLRDRYSGRHIKKNLQTSDPVEAAKLVDRLNAEVEREWSHLRQDPTRSPEAVEAHARDFLRRNGVNTEDIAGSADALDVLYESFDRKRGRYARGNEEVFAEAEPSEFLSPVEVAAVEMLRQSNAFTLRDALTFYLETHTKAGSGTLDKASRYAINSFVKVVGNKALVSIRRSHGHQYVESELKRGVSTGTIRRRLKSLVAIINHCIVEKELDYKNPITALKIPREGEDAKKRISFTPDELVRLKSLCKDTDDSPRWLLALLIDTGARLSEIAGLKVQDIDLSSDIPSVFLRPQEARGLKTLPSEREVPLVGSALWAAKRAVSSSRAGQVFLFEYCIRNGKCDANSISATLIHWIRRRGFDHVVHELRHAMKDRLRAVQCPDDISDAIGGWGRKTVSQRYGQGYSLKVKQEWLDKVVTPDTTSS